MIRRHLSNVALSLRRHARIFTGELGDGWDLARFLPWYENLRVCGITGHVLGSNVMRFWIAAYINWQRPYYRLIIVRHTPCDGVTQRPTTRFTAALADSKSLHSAPICCVFFIVVYLQIAGDSRPPKSRGRFKPRFQKRQPYASSRRSRGSINRIYAGWESMTTEAKLSDLFTHCQELCHRIVTYIVIESNFRRCWIAIDAR